MRIGITLIASFFLFLFASTIFVSVSILLFKDEFKKEFEKQVKIEDINYDELIFIAFIFGIFASILYLTSGMGLLMLKEWGRKIAVFLSALHAAYGILTIKIFYIAIPNLTIGFLIFSYLNRKEVKSEFAKKVSIEEKILGTKF